MVRGGGGRLCLYTPTSREMQSIFFDQEKILPCWLLLLPLQDAWGEPPHSLERGEEMRILSGLDSLSQPM